MSFVCLCPCLPGIISWPHCLYHRGQGFLKRAWVWVPGANFGEGVIWGSVHICEVSSCTRNEEGLKEEERDVCKEERVILFPQPSKSNWSQLSQETVYKSHWAREYKWGRRKVDLLRRYGVASFLMNFLKGAFQMYTWSLLLLVNFWCSVKNCAFSQREQFCPQLPSF